MSQDLFESEGAPAASARVEFIGVPVGAQRSGFGTVTLILLALLAWPLWLAWAAIAPRKARGRLIIDPASISWRKADSSEGRVSIALAQIDHVEVHRHGVVPSRIVLVAKSGGSETIPGEFSARSAQGILAELHQSVVVREIDLPEREVARRDEVEALATSGRAAGEREELPDGVRWIAKPSQGGLLFLALLLATICVAVNAGVFSKHGDFAMLSSCLTVVLAVPLFIGLARASSREPLELHVTKGGFSCGRPSEPELWEHIPAEDLQAIHWSKVEVDEGTSWQLVFKTVQGDFVEMGDSTLSNYGPDICHVASTLHPHVKLALANLPHHSRCRSWPRKA